MCIITGSADDSVNEEQIAEEGQNEQGQNAQGQVHEEGEQLAENLQREVNEEEQIAEYHNQDGGVNNMSDLDQGISSNSENEGMHILYYSF